METADDQETDTGSESRPSGSDTAARAAGAHYSRSSDDTHRIRVQKDMHINEYQTVYPAKPSSSDLPTSS